MTSKRRIRRFFWRLTPEWVQLNIFGVTPPPPLTTRESLEAASGWADADTHGKLRKYENLTDSLDGETQVMSWAFDKLNGMQIPLGVILGFELTILVAAPTALGAWIAFGMTAFSFIFVQWALSARLKVYGKVPDLGLQALKIDGSLESRVKSKYDWLWSRSHTRYAVERKQVTATILMSLSVLATPLAIGAVLTKVEHLLMLIPH